MSDRDQGTAPRQAVVEVLLEEDLGAFAPRDLTAAVVSRFAADGGAAAVRGAPVRGSVHRRWLAVAMLLLGLGVVFAVTWSRSQHGDAMAQDPQPVPEAGDVLPVRDLDQLRALLPQVTRVELELQTLGDADLPTIDVSGVPIVATDEWRRSFVGALAADGRVEQPAGWDWQNRLSLVLGSGQRLAMAIDTHDHDARQTLGLRGLQGDLSLGGAGAIALRDLLATARHVARLAHGIVLRPQDLDGEDAFPVTLEEMRLFGLAEADLEHLQRYPNLRRLDLSGLRHPLGETALRHLAACQSIEDLTANGVEFPDDQLILLTGLVSLRHWHLRGVHGFTGEGFGHLTNSSRRRAPTGSIDLRDVPTLTDAGLRCIADHGAPELLLGGAGGNIGVDGWRALMASPRLRRLDLSHWSLDASRIADLARRIDLDELVLDGCALDAAALATLATTKAPLRRVSLRAVPGLTVAAITPLCDLGTLREVDLIGVDGLAMDELAVLAFLKTNVQFVR